MACSVLLTGEERAVHACEDITNAEIITTLVWRENVKENGAPALHGVPGPRMLVRRETLQTVTGNGIIILGHGWRNPITMPDSPGFEHTEGIRLTCERYASRPALGKYLGLRATCEKLTNSPGFGIFSAR